MNCVVTGGSGFIGTNLLIALSKSGYFERIVSLDYVPLSKPIANVHSISVDVRDIQALRDSLENAEVVFHLAASANVNYVNGDPFSTIGNNVGVTAALLEASRCAGVRRFIFASTVWVYIGASDDILSETTSLFPGSTTNIYASTKIACELLCRTYQEQYGLRSTILRFETPYGPYLRPDMVVHRFVRQAMDGEPLTVAGGGKQTRDFIHVKDLTECTILAAMAPIAGGKTYNVTGPRPVSIRELAEVVLSEVPNSPPIVFVDGRQSDLDVRRISRTLAQTELGWQPKIDIREGVRDVFAWLRGQVTITGEARAQIAAK